MDDTTPAMAAPGPPVQVRIVAASARRAPSAWVLEYEVRNPGPASAWIVSGEALALRQGEGTIELSFARSPLQPGAQVFGYFAPATVELAAGDSLRRHVDIAWPCQLSDLWNAGREAAPPPGWYAVSVRIGYAAHAVPPPPGADEDVQAPVWRWQREATSAPARLELYPY